MGDSAGLCVACGLCCDGTLFNRAKTSPAEAARVRGYGLSVYPDEKHFALPCHHLDGTACTIYADRFEICRSFRCRLLRAVDADEVTRERADAAVVEAKRLRAVAAAKSPGSEIAETRVAVLNGLADWAKRPDPDERRAAAETYLALAALERFVEANFRLPRKVPLAAEAASGEAGTKGTS